MSEIPVSDTRLHLAVIIGSTREGRLGPIVAKWFASQAGIRDDLTVDLIDLADAHLPDVMSTTGSTEVLALSARLTAADAFVIVTPEYNHSFPAALKNAIDWYSVEWRAKPVGFVSYGGMSGGLRAVEQLRQVFAELHAVTVRDSVSFHGVWGQFSSDGQPRNEEVPNKMAQSMLARLVWWAHALRDARTTRPYAA